MAAADENSIRLEPLGRHIVSALAEGAMEVPVLTRDGLVRLNGAAVRFDAAGVLHWPEAELVAVADLHLEKGSSQGRRGLFVPPYDTRATLAALEGVLARLKPRMVVALGDSFHDRDGEGRLDPADADAAEGPGARRRLVLDQRQPRSAAAARSRRDLRRECSRSAASSSAMNPPAGTPVRSPATFTRRRGSACADGACVGAPSPRDGRRCVLPAFGAYTGGLNVLDRAYRGLFDRSRLVAWMIGEDRALSGARSRAAAGLTARISRGGT